MKLLKKLLSVILTVTMIFMVPTSYSYAKDESKDNLYKEKLHKLEENIKDKGYEYATKKGLLMTIAEYEEFNQYYDQSGDINDKGLAKYEKYIIKSEDILKENPELKKDADELNFYQYKHIDIANVSDANLLSAYTTEGYNYRLNTNYVYTEETTYDTRSAQNLTELQSAVIGIITIGLKPAASIAFSVLSSVMSYTAAQNCTNYEMKSTYHYCRTYKEGQYYSYILGFEYYSWVVFAVTQREDTYAKMAVDAWYANQFYPSVKSTLVSYWYDDVFYQESFIQTVTQNEYIYYMAQNNNQGVPFYVYPLKYYDRDVVYTNYSPF